VERSLVRGALARDRDRDAVRTAPAERERLAECGRVSLGDDARAREVRRGVEQVHVTATAVTEAGLAAEDLGGHRSHVHAVRDREVVRAVGGRHGVVRGEVSAHPGGNGFLARREVHLAGDEPLADVEARALVGVVVAPDRLLERADQDHRAVQPEPGRAVHDALRRMRTGGCGGGHDAPPGVR
jgi:hypothetical protein